jgi:hypothetical protein
MKYICLGYIEPGKFENMSESERNTVLDECFSYNDELRKKRTSCCGGTSSARQHGGDRVLEERKGCSEHRLPGRDGLDRLHPFTEAAARKLVSGVKPVLQPEHSFRKRTLL